jgi:hypothetical protein
MPREEIVFSTFIPLMGHKILGPGFSHKGQYESAQFSISVKDYNSENPDFIKLLSDFQKKVPPITNIGTFEADLKANSFIRIDVKHTYKDDYKILCSTLEQNRIATAIISALRLHSSKGISYHRHYYYRNFPAPGYMSGICENGKSYTSDFSNMHLGQGKSVLNEVDYDKGRDTFDILIKGLTEETSVENLISIAISYHAAVYHFSIIEHSFLILMVIFESLFKRHSENNASQAAIRISKLLDQNGSKDIQKLFFDNSPESFCNLRNDIAHGNFSSNKNIVKAKFPILYHYITKSIIALISLKEEHFDISQNYYDELDKYLNN